MKYCIWSNGHHHAQIVLYLNIRGDHFICYSEEQFGYKWPESRCGCILSEGMVHIVVLNPYGPCHKVICWQYCIIVTPAPKYAHSVNSVAAMVRWGKDRGWSGYIPQPPTPWNHDAGTITDYNIIFKGGSIHQFYHTIFSCSHYSNETPFLNQYFA